MNQCLCNSSLKKYEIKFYKDDFIVYVCENCLRKNVLEAKTRNKDKNINPLYPENFYLYRKIPEKFWNANVLNHTKDQDYFIKIWNMAKENNFQNGLILQGEVGVGKTYLLYAFLKDICMDNKHREILFIDEFEMFKDLKERMGEHTKLGRDYIEKASEADIIFYDDLGSQIKTVNGEWGKEKLFDLINICYLKNITLIISTNLSKKQIYESLGNRTADRLEELHFIEMIEKESKRKLKPLK